MAHMEAASVHAFERLAAELDAHGAPASLRRAALAAADDERRHARVVSRLARRAGTTPPRPSITRVRARSLEAIARENAVEGCVHETFAAALALVQGACARDDDVRTAMRRIGADELRHAELAWQVARWADSRLDAAARRRVGRGRTRAAAALVRRTACSAVAHELVTTLGLPTAAQARGIATEIQRTLWGRSGGVESGWRSYGKGAGGCDAGAREREQWRAERVARRGSRVEGGRSREAGPRSRDMGRRSSE